MRGEIVGIIAEGAEDQGVLKNILRAFGFDGSEIRFIRPSLGLDATDQHNNEQTIGTFQGVKNACVGKDGKRPDFENALAVQNCNHIVIHLDTAEIEEHNFDFNRPDKENSTDYCTELRNAVIQLIQEWLEGNYKEITLFAIAIEEVEAWCLTIFEKNTNQVINSKGKLGKHLSKNNMTPRKYKIHPTKKRQYFEAFTKDKKFHRKRNLVAYAENNESLQAFINDLEKKFLPIS